jgi:sigma-E factor negative regulatory protein RseC
VSRRIVFRQGAAALLPPVLGFAAGFTLTGLFFPLAGEGQRIAAGAALMFLLALGIYLFRRPSPESL